MYEFEFERPGTVEQASALLKADPDARVIAGGMSLLPAMKLRLSQVSTLADLSTISELKGIRQDGDRLVIGAMMRHCDVAASALVQDLIPALAKTAGGIGDRQVRNRGTIGGSLANNDPAADYPAAALALDATVHTNLRAIPADAFFIDIYTTALEEGEIIREVSFPVPAAADYVKFIQQASRFALVGVFVSRAQSGAVRVAVTGAGPSVFRCPELEAALNAEFSPEAAQVEIDASELNTDIHGDAEYRAHLIAVMAGRAVGACLTGGTAGAIDES